MSSRLSFRTDAESEEFCGRIAYEMVRLFHISLEEAISRINRQWRGQEIVSPKTMVYHEDAVFWAKEIYFEQGSRWWLDESNAKAKPYP
jgi:hypothetical protein